jgi:hypothetical protein
MPTPPKKLHNKLDAFIDGAMDAMTGGLNHYQCYAPTGNPDYDENYRRGYEMGTLAALIAANVGMKYKPRSEMENKK